MTFLMGKLSLRKVKWPGCQQPVLHVRTNDMLSLRVLEGVYMAGGGRGHTHMKTPVPPPSKGCDRDWNEGLCGCREGEATKGNMRGALLTFWVASDC